MDLEKYKIEASEDLLEYSFYSRGPKGSIKKVAYFTPVNVWNSKCYNFGFGDWNDNNQTINDTITTNNQDTEKVLASVADILISFSNHFPKETIYIEASTESRMRLYQMKINKYWKEIEAYFELIGVLEDSRFIPYKPGNKCLGFLGKRKIR